MGTKKHKLSKQQLGSIKKPTLVDFTYGLIAEVNQLQDTVEELTERLNVLTNEEFGRKSEKRSVLDDLEGLFFNEAEVIVSESTEVELKEPSAEDISPAIGKERKPHPKGTRDSVISELVQREETCRLDDGSLVCICGGDLKPAGCRTVQRLEFHPSYFEVVNYRVWQYECTRCGAQVSADGPVQLFEGSLATPSLLAGIATAKYVNAMPFDRMGRYFEQLDVFIPKQTMARWMIRIAYDYFWPIYDRMRQELIIMNRIVHSDETTVIVSKDGRKAGAKSYMWVYTDENSDHPVVIYEYQKTRAGKHPKEFLKGFKGWLCCDGYEAYHSMDSDITICGCWAHARRHYSNAVKALKNLPHRSGEMTIAEQALTRIGELFHLDSTWEGLSYEERLELRNTELKDKMYEYFDWVESVADSVSSKTETGKGLRYSLNQKQYLLGLLSNPDIPLDNSEAERKIRNFVVSRKNFIMIDTLAGAEASAIMFSMSETLKANGLKAHEYFRYILTEMPKHMNDSSKDMSFLEDLLPWSENLPDDIRKKQK